MLSAIGVARELYFVLELYHIPHWDAINRGLRFGQQHRSTEDRHKETGPM